jgi:hypothetical protein
LSSWLRKLLMVARPAEGRLTCRRPVCKWHRRWPAPVPGGWLPIFLWRTLRCRRVPAGTRDCRPLHAR